MRRSEGQTDKGPRELLEYRRGHSRGTGQVPVISEVLVRERAVGGQTGVVDGFVLAGDTKAEFELKTLYNPDTFLARSLTWS